jgi:hypothetical protein
LDGLDAEAGQFIPCEGGRRLLIRERFDGLPATPVKDATYLSSQTSIMSMTAASLAWD